MVASFEVILLHNNMVNLGKLRLEGLKHVEIIIILCVHVILPPFPKYPFFVIVPVLVVPLWPR